MTPAPDTQFPQEGLTMRSKIVTRNADSMLFSTFSSGAVIPYFRRSPKEVTIIARAGMGSESIAHSAFGLIGY